MLIGSLPEQLGLFWRQSFDKPEGTAPATETPVRRLARAEVEAAPDGSLWRLAHATVLIKLGGRYWLTDPMFSERASPLQFAGPRRFHRSPIAIDEVRVHGVARPRQAAAIAPTRHHAKYAL